MLIVRLTDSHQQLATPEVEQWLDDVSRTLNASDCERLAREQAVALSAFGTTLR